MEGGDLMDRNLQSIIKESCREYASQDAFVFNRNNQEFIISYKEFYKDIVYLGSFLYNLNLSNYNIAIVGSNSYEWIVIYFSVIYGLGTAILLDPNSENSDIKYKLKDSEAELVFYSDEVDIQNISKEMSSIKYWIYIGDKKEESETYKKILEKKIISEEFKRLDKKATDICTIFYTSGTTKNPKGVVLTNDNIISVIEAQQIVCSLGKKYFSILPFSHSYSCVIGVLGVFKQGGNNFIGTGMKQFWNELAQFSPETLIIVPAIANYIIKYWDKNIFDKGKHSKEQCQKAVNMLGGKIKYILCGGAPFNPNYFYRFKELNIDIFNGYGITECSPLISVNRIEYNNPLSAGQIVPCCEVKINNTPNQKIGEILVKGKNVMKGYYKNEYETKRAFENNWFKTGDLGYLDEEGFLYIVGRCKNLIVLSSGYNVCPEELEAYLQNIMYIEEAIISHEVKNGKDIINAIIKIADTDEIENKKRKIEECIYRLNKELPYFKRIGEITFVNSFKKTYTGKIIRRINYDERACEKNTC